MPVLFCVFHPCTCSCYLSSLSDRYVHSPLSGGVSRINAQTIIRIMPAVTVGRRSGSAPKSLAEATSPHTQGSHPYPFHVPRTPIDNPIDNPIDTPIDIPSDTPTDIRSTPRRVQIRNCFWRRLGPHPDSVTLLLTRAPSQPPLQAPHLCTCHPRRHRCRLEPTNVMNGREGFWK